MAYTFYVGNVPANGSVAMFDIKSNLVTGTWTVTKSGDGLALYSAVGDVIVSSGSGAGGMANTRAWFCIQQPGSTREWCIQRSTGNTTWRVKYSPGGFGAGAPNANTVPSASDEVVVIGSGTDAAPGGASGFSTDGAYRVNMAVGGAAEGYAWYAMGNVAGSSNMSWMWMHDPLQAGSYPAGDLDPLVVYVSVVSSIISQLQNTYATQAKGFLGALATANGVSMGLLTYAQANAGFPGFMGVSPWSGNDVIVPTMWGRNNTVAAPIGFKGFSTLIQTGSALRTNLDTLTVLSTRDFIYVNGYWLPWNGSVPVL